MTTKRTYRFSNGPLILASESPRRRMLLERLTPEFEVIPHTFDENANRCDSPEQAALEHAKHKALNISEKHPKRIVVGADTIVTVDGQILGKPLDEADARRILRLLSGSRHRVITGVCLAQDAAILDAYAETTVITMGIMTDSDIDAYIQSGEPFGKAGAYAIQETGDRFVQKVEGSFSNVVGLPVESLTKHLEPFLEN